MQKVAEEVTTVGTGGQSETDLDPTAPDEGDDDDDQEQAAG